jgi:hypothetical protein
VVSKLSLAGCPTVVCSGLFLRMIAHIFFYKTMSWVLVSMGLIFFKKKFFMDRLAPR